MGTAGWKKKVFHCWHFEPPENVSNKERFLLIRVPPSALQLPCDEMDWSQIGQDRRQEEEVFHYEKFHPAGDVITPWQV